MATNLSPETRSVLQTLDRFDSEGQSAKSELSESWDRLIQKFRGAASEGQPAPFANLIAPVVDRKVALLTESKPILRVTPRRKGIQQTAKILQATIEAGWDEYSMDQVLDDIGQLLEILGSAAIKLPFIPSADDGQGDIVPSSLDPRNLWFDPMVTKSYKLDTAQFLVIESVEPLWQIWRRFPGVGQLVKPDPRVSSVPPPKTKRGGWRTAISKVFRVGQHLDPGAVPRCVMREYWFHDPSLTTDGKLKYPFGRHILRGIPDVLLVDEPNQYWDGGWDVELLDGRPDPDHPWGRSEVEALLRIQEATSQIASSFVENALLTGNVWITTDHDALETDAIQKLKDIGAIIITKKFGRTVERQAPPPIPAHFLEFVRLGLQLVDILSGLSETTLQGKGRMEVRSGSQLEGLQLATQTLVRAIARRLEGFLQRVGQKWISRIFQFYNADRMLTFLGPGNDWMTFEFERQLLVNEILQQVQKEVTRHGTVDAKDLGEKFRARIRQAWRDFRFKITPGSSLAVTKVQRALMFAELARNLMVPRTMVLRELGLENPEELVQQALEEAQTIGPPQPAMQRKPSGTRRTAVP